MLLLAEGLCVFWGAAFKGCLQLQLGAVDILRTPIASQQDRLATLWQHAVRKGKEQPSALPKAGRTEGVATFQHAADAISEVCFMTTMNHHGPSNCCASAGQAILVKAMQTFSMELRMVQKL